MIELSDQNMATNPQCYKDREDYSIDVVLPFSVYKVNYDNSYT